MDAFGRSHDLGVFRRQSIAWLCKSEKPCTAAQPSFRIEDVRRQESEYFRAPTLDGRVSAPQGPHYARLCIISRPADFALQSCDPHSFDGSTAASAALAAYIGPLAKHLVKSPHHAPPASTICSHG
jgi:hypothetical protein